MTENQITFFESGLVIAFITAFLYCANATYYGGYFATFLLDSDLLDQNFHQILYSGLLKSMPLFTQLFPFLLFLVLLRTIYSHLVLPELSKSWNSKRRLIKIKWKLLSKKKDKKIVQNEKKKSIITLLYLGGFVIFIFTIVLFEKNGNDAANLILKKIETNAIQENELITVKIDGKSEKLFHLMCGARNCAGIDPKTKVVYYFPQNGHSFQLRENKAK